mgnify:FL=1
MARTDSFFIRAQVLTDGVNYNEAAIDLGAYVDALGKSVLRIHNVQVQYGTAGTYIGGRSPNMVSGTQYQLTTQSQVGLVSLNNRSVVSSGALNYNTDGADAILSVTEVLDAGPQHWTDGYLIAVEQMYLGVSQGTPSLDAVSIVLECTVETMTQAAAMALALSQQ